MDLEPRVCDIDKKISERGAEMIWQVCSRSLERLNKFSNWMYLSTSNKVILIQSTGIDSSRKIFILGGSNDEKNMDDEMTQIVETIKELPEEAQRAVYWIITHFDFVKEICKNSEMTNEEIERYKEEAWEKEDYLLLALLAAAQAFNNDEISEQ